MSSETRTMLVVLVVCGFLMVGCIVLPLGVGAAFFFIASRRAEMAMAEQAVAVERAATARAQADAQVLQQALQDAVPTPPITAPPTPTIPSVDLNSLPAAPEQPNIPAPPFAGLPGGLSDVLPSDIAATMLADVEQRKLLYKGIKEMRANEEKLKKLPGIDPSALAAFQAVKQQAEATFKAIGLTEDQINKILEEGDKAGW